MHDVIAHNVSVMVVQADGAAFALDAEPDRARRALDAISGTGRQALTEMRRSRPAARPASPRSPQWRKRNVPGWAAPRGEPAMWAA